MNFNALPLEARVELANAALASAEADVIELAYAKTADFDCPRAKAAMKKASELRRTLLTLQNETAKLLNT